MKYNLLHPRSFVVEICDFTHEGFTASGIQIERRDFTHSGTWKNTGRVVLTNECRDVKFGDLVVFRKHAPKTFHSAEGELKLLLEHQVLGIVRRGDGSSWFLS